MLVVCTNTLAGVASLGTHDFRDLEYPSAVAKNPAENPIWVEFREVSESVFLRHAHPLMTILPNFNFSDQMEFSGGFLEVSSFGSFGSCLADFMRVLHFWTHFRNLGFEKLSIFILDRMGTLGNRFKI